MIGSKAEIRPIEQQDITALLDRLKELRQRIAEACVPLTELEYNMVRAHDEFQAAAGYLRQHALRLQAEITTLRARIDEALWNEEEEDEGNGIDYSGRNGGVQEREREDTSITHDPEAEAKEILFRHLYWVLDPDIEDADADLVARLEGMAREPTTRLSDLLQELKEWGPVWEDRGIHESLQEQHRRLEMWVDALSRQLQQLKRARERLEEDWRYDLWERRQQGDDAWRAFLQQVVEQQREYNLILQAELESMRQQWEQVANQL